MAMCTTGCLSALGSDTYTVIGSLLLRTRGHWVRAQSSLVEALLLVEAEGSVVVDSSLVGPGGLRKALTCCRPGC
eukprot:241133-Amphidinium_carterae.1